MKSSSDGPFQRLGELALFACAVLLPTAFFLRAYDPAAIKTAVLQWGAIAATAAWVLQGLARGRFAVSAASWTPLLPALLYGAWSLLSFVLSGHKVAALPLALDDAAMLAAYLAAFVGLAGARSAARFAAFIVLAGWVVAAYALAQAVGVDPLAWRGAWGEGLLRHRAFSTFAQPGACAAFLALLPPAALALTQDPETPPALRAASLALLPVAAAAAVLTQAPWGLLGFVVVSGVYAALASWTTGTKAAARAALYALTAAAAVGAASALTGSVRAGALADGLRERRAVAAAAWRMAAQRPLVGVGPGAFEAVYPGSRSAEDARLDASRADASPRPASTLLGALAETGFVGAFLWLWLFGAALWSGLSGASALRRAGAVAESAYAAGFTAAAAGALLCAQFDGSWRLAAPGWFLWAFAGLGAGLSALAAKRAPVSAYPLPVSPEIRRALYAPGLLAALAAAAVPGLGLRAEVDHNLAVHHARGGRLDEAVALWEKVPFFSARHAASLYSRGDARLEQDRPEEALAYYDRLRAVSPDYALVHAKRGEALGRLGRWEEAVAARARQAELDPRLVPNLVALAEAARAAGDLDAARRAVARAKAEAPEDAGVKLQDAANALHERRLLAESARRKALERRGTARKTGP
ncbi:MAG: tetratricopeptide repeat protein [Elusimicrobiota bacterium]|nr:tetratricopeptide repeat protein [Elusimicrobiota bacterium]